jgi:hypothetical protein
MPPDWQPHDLVATNRSQPAERHQKYRDRHVERVFNPDRKERHWVGGGWREIDNLWAMRHCAAGTVGRATH